MLCFRKQLIQHTVLLFEKVFWVASELFQSQVLGSSCLKLKLTSHTILTSHNYLLIFVDMPLPPMKPPLSALQ